MCRDVDGSATRCMDKSVKTRAELGKGGHYLLKSACPATKSARGSNTSKTCVAYQFRYNERGLNDDMSVSVTKKVEVAYDAPAEYLRCISTRTTMKRYQKD
jgi:hypothetical protein